MHIIVSISCNMSPKTDSWVRLFDVSDPIRHKKGYTVYKVTSKVYPRWSPEGVSEIVVWKRFSDFKKLYKSLQILHSKLYLKGSFPVFAKSRLFGRFDDRVIEERRQSSLQLLEFVAQHPPLFTSQIFVKFFENGQRLNSKIHLPREQEIATPTTVVDLETASTTATATTTVVDSGLGNATCEISDRKLSLGGIWNYRQDQESISLSSESDITSTTDGDSMLSLADSDLAQFDPLREIGSPSKRNIDDNNTNSWLLAALMECNQTDDSFNSPTHKPASLNEDFFDLDKCSLDSSLSRNLNANITSSNTDRESTSTTAESPPLTPLSPFSPEFKDDDNYILNAADAISLAQQNEANGKYQEAFAYYKMSVEVLLKGVQGDTNELRRDAVRKKTAQYLSRAEAIYKTHLAQRAQDDNRWGTIHVSKDPLLGLLQAPVSDLKNYRVLGVIDKVLLVLDVTDNQTYVMKIIRKAASSDEWSVPSVVPSRHRYMVQLYKFIENDYAIFLVLEHATGGKLWVYVKSYLQQSPVTPQHSKHKSNINSNHEEITENFIIHSNQTPTETSNVYSGRKLMNQEDDEFYQKNHNDRNNHESQDSKIDEADLDLIADDKCASSYSRLFTTYAASLPSDHVVGLAKCHITHQDHDQDVQEDTEETVTETDEIECDNIQEIETNAFINDNNVEPILDLRGAGDAGNVPITDMEQVTTIEDLGKIHAEDLISCAQRLIKTVDKTIRESKDVEFPRAETETCIANAGESGKVKGKQTRSVSTSSFTNGRRRRQRISSRPMSEESLFSSPVHETLLSLSAGSLAEIGRPRLRHLSMVFQQLDFSNNWNACLPETCVRVWAAEMVVAVSQLHNLGIICRDLCPDNILLGSRGHILLTYFCQWGCVDRVLRADAIDNLYAAPEVATINPVSPACDWWSVGALLFELLSGKSLVLSHPGGINSHTSLNIPSHTSAEAQSFLKELLRFNPTERLGAAHNGVEALRAHSFFQGIDWDRIIHGDDA